jgi:diaminohydroxyphosphoribosylaminopyrimidine deaminase / 5-amino-6-(5-phosphoribosylamino)uracil reductase
MNIVDTYYLWQALIEARRGEGDCAPNPAVGAVIVKGNQIVARGFHARAGLAHAERDAIERAEVLLEGATIYVTLLPCCHHGKTPPCTDAIIAAGIKTVVFAHQDTNPDVAHQSEQILLAKGVAVRHVPLPEITEFYSAYDYWRTYNRVFLSAKLAVSLDQCIADAAGGPIAITGEACREFTHQQRRVHDAILTSCQTVLADDPKLNVRLNNVVLAKPLYVIDRNLSLPLDARILQTAKQVTILHSDCVQSSRIALCRERDIRCLAVKEKNDQLDWLDILSVLADDGMHSVWLEAGARLFHSAVSSGLCAHAYLYIGNKELKATPIALPHFCVGPSSHRLGEDIMLHYRLI